MLGAKQTLGKYLLHEELNDFSLCAIRTPQAVTRVPLSSDHTTKLSS